MSLIEKIKSLLTTETVNEKFLDAKLVDGTLIRIEGDAFKVGEKVQVITEAGEIVDAPEGEHELEDGTVIVIDAESKITEVRTPEVVEETPAEDAKEDMADAPVEAADMPAESSDYEARVVALEDKVKALEEAIMMLIDKLQGNMESLSAVKAENEDLKAENVKLSKQPAAKPFSFKKNEKEAVAPKTDKKFNMLEKVIQAKK